MKVFVVFSAIFAMACASGLTTLYTAEAPILTQYHSQDELGQYAYGYNGGQSAKVETKSIDGVTRGSYSYVDSNGILQTVEYTADALNGFRAAATNLPRAPIDNAVAPEPVRDTFEVIQARADHMAAYNLAQKQFNEAATRTAIERTDSIETIATPLATIPIAQITPLTATSTGQFILRTAEFPRASFAYRINTPTYTTGQFYANSPYQYTYAAPILAARNAPLEIRPASLEIHPAPVELRTPIDTPEVIKARAEHMAAVEKEKARIAAATN